MTDALGIPGAVVVGGQACYRIPGHPLASKRGYVPCGRAQLYEKLRVANVSKPVCFACGARVVWRRGGAGRTMKRVGGVRPMLVWYLDGDEANVRHENLEPVCQSCSLHLGGRAQRQPRDERGAWTR